MSKIKSYLKKGILILSLYLVCQLFVSGLFGVSAVEEGGFAYAIAGTILILYLYGKRKEE